jgi:hypothetical protein
MGFRTHVRSAVLFGVFDAMTFAWRIRVALLLSTITATVGYFTTANVAAFYGLLSWPIAVLLGVVWFVARQLMGRGGRQASYRRPPWAIAPPRETPRLNLEWGDGDFPDGLRCLVREPGGLIAECIRTHAYNGFLYPAEFPEHIPPAPGPHRAVWFMRLSPRGWWWKLVSLEFEVEPMLQPNGWER